MSLRVCPHPSPSGGLCDHCEVKRRARGGGAVNVDRMRRYSEGAREASDRREWQAWIASHDHTRPVCSACLNRGLSRGLPSMRKASENFVRAMSPKTHESRPTPDA